MGSARVWETWPWGLFLWGVAVPVCFLCPFPPFLREATWPAGDYIFSPNGVSELRVLGESSEATERLYVSVCMCRRWVFCLRVTKCLTYSNYCCICYNCRERWDSPNRFHMRKRSGYLRPSIPKETRREEKERTWKWPVRKSTGCVKYDRTASQLQCLKFAFNDCATSQYLPCTDLLVSGPCACPLYNMRFTSTGELAIFES